MKLFGNLNIEGNNLKINGVTMTELKEKFGTPLYIIDENDFINKCRIFKENFDIEGINTKVLYASKALLNTHIARIVNDEGLGFDVVSGGEIYTLLKSGIGLENTYFHGNNKLYDELELAINNNIGTIVIDNESEVDDIESILVDKKQRALLRINPGIEAHTHDYISTSKNDSKFGISIYDERIIELIKRLINSKNIDLIGFHAHIGSQIFDSESFFKECEEVLNFVSEIEKKAEYRFSEINLGGGFGIYYTDSDTPFEISEFLRQYSKKIKEEIDKRNLSIKSIVIEPGRSLISNSGHTLYTVGSTKETYAGRNYIFIDGGMTDNIRPALYQAEYEACVANKMSNEETIKYTIAGKCCESGDIIIKDILLPRCEKGDLILVSSTGAYNYSMSSNYNRIPRPAMVSVGNEPRLIIKRETFEDIIRNDILGEEI